MISSDVSDHETIAAHRERQRRMTALVGEYIAASLIESVAAENEGTPEELETWRLAVGRLSRAATQLSEAVTRPTVAAITGYAEVANGQILQDHPWLQGGPV